MEYDIKKLYNDITDVENELNRLVENGEEYNKIYEQSVVTDKVIAKYLKAKQYLEQERGRILKDYSNLIDTPFKDEIISQIRQEVKCKFPNVQEKELNHFSNNVYIYGMLIVCGIKEQEIVEQLLYLNNKYFEENQKKGIIIDSKIECNDLSYLTELKEKYIKIIKEKI